MRPRPSVALCNPTGIQQRLGHSAPTGSETPPCVVTPCVHETGQHQDAHRTRGPGICFVVFMGGVVPLHVVIQWSVPEGKEAETDAALQRIAEHIKTEHPGISACRVLRQIAGGEVHCAYQWLEEYPSFSALEAETANMTAECDEMWQPIRDLEIPGTRRQTMWSDAGKKAWFSRTTE